MPWRRRSLFIIAEDPIRPHAFSEAHFRTPGSVDSGNLSSSGRTRSDPLSLPAPGALDNTRVGNRYIDRDQTPGADSVIIRVSAASISERFSEYVTIRVSRLLESRYSSGTPLSFRHVGQAQLNYGPSAT